MSNESGRSVEVVLFLLGPYAARVCWPTDDHSPNVSPRRWQLCASGPQSDALRQISPRPKSKRLTNPAEIVESSKPQRSLLSFTQTRTRNVKADQVKNNAVTELSQGPRLSAMLGRVTGLVAQASKQASNPTWERARLVILSKGCMLPASDCIGVLNQSYESGQGAQAGQCSLITT
jgi:hypothetical protein